MPGQYRRFIHIVVPIYGQWVELFRNPNDAGAYLKMSGQRDADIDEALADSAGMVESLGAIHVVYLPRRCLVGTLAHECAHLASAILRTAQVEHDSDHEAFTYLVGWLVDEIAPHVRPRLR